MQPPGLDVSEDPAQSDVGVESEAFQSFRHGSAAPRRSRNEQSRHADGMGLLRAALGAPERDPAIGCAALVRDDRHRPRAALAAFHQQLVRRRSHALRTGRNRRCSSCACRCCRSSICVGLPVFGRKVRACSHLTAPPNANKLRWIISGSTSALAVITSCTLAAIPIFGSLGFVVMAGLLAW